MKKYVALVAASFVLISCSAGNSFLYLERAQQAVREDDASTAIDCYEKHIEQRLNQEEREEWENPHFYYLLIGDLQLDQKQPQEALKSYLLAKEHGVDTTFISDRLRSLAAWYQERGQLQAAFSLLKRHRSLDPLLFDTTLDRLARKMVASEKE